MIMAAGNYDVNNLFEQSGRRWLKPAELVCILENHHTNHILRRVPDKPTSGSLFLFNRNAVSSFRGDGHNWKKKMVQKKGKEAKMKVKEAHMTLKVDKVDVLKCYYAKGEDNPRFNRRCYWMLNGPKKHIVLVHYMDELQGETNPASASGQSCSFIQSDTVLPLQNQDTAYLNEMHGSNESLNSLVAEQQGMDHVNYLNGSPEVDPTQFWQGILDEQCGLNCDIAKESIAFDNMKQDTDVTAKSAVLGCDNGAKEFGHGATLPHGYYGTDDGMLSDLTVPAAWEEIGKMLNFRMRCLKTSNAKVCWHLLHNVIAANSKAHSEGSLPVTQGAENFEWPARLGITDMAVEVDHNLTLVPDHNFNIREISPEWGFVDEATKVIIVGSFHCDPSKTDWACTFGDTEVPIRIIQEGVICCEAPPNRSAGKVTLRLTSRNGESCSEVKGFEYHDRIRACNNCIMAEQEENRSMEEVRLFARFVQMLLSNSSLWKDDSNNFNMHPPSVQKRNQDSSDNSTQGLQTGCGTSSSTIDQVLQELLEDKLQQWLCARLVGGGDLKEKGIIHIVAALGCEWALNPILVSGVGVNFRDIKGWSALHWAAQFGREKMAVALINSGACARAVTDPTTEEPNGRSPASIAEENGHKGIAGYLSEFATISHLSSLTLEEAGTGDLEAVDVGDMSNTYVASGDDQHTMKQVLAASRKTTQAATLIQYVFRAHSFRKRHQREAASYSSVDEYGFTPDVIQSLSSASKKVLPRSHDHNVDALPIHQDHRCGKVRKGFFKLCRKVVKIQPCISGNRVRKYYELIRAVNFLEKAVLRWPRKGAGLRGYKPGREVIDENEEDEDILKDFRRQKVDTHINEALSMVQSMIHCPEARNQYARMIETFQQSRDISPAAVDFTDIDTDAALFQLPTEFPPDSPGFSELWTNSVC